MGIQRWWVYKSLWQRIGAMTIPQFGQICSIFWLFWPWQGIRLTLLDLGKFLPALDNPSRYGEVDVSQKNAKMTKKNETKTFMKTLGFSPGGTVKTLYMPLSDLGAEGPEIPQVLRRLIEALFHCFPGHFALGRPYGAKKTQKLQQNYPGKRPQTVWRE